MNKTVITIIKDSKLAAPQNWGAALKEVKSNSKEDSQI